MYIYIISTLCSLTHILLPLFAIRDVVECRHIVKNVKCSHTFFYKLYMPFTMFDLLFSFFFSYFSLKFYTLIHSICFFLFTKFTFTYTLCISGEKKNIEQVFFTERTLHYSSYVCSTKHKNLKTHAVFFFFLWK